MKTVLLIFSIIFLMVTGACAGSVTYQWDLYTDQENIDGFNFYKCTTTPCEVLPANKIGTSTAKNATSQVFNGIPVGQIYGMMTAYKGTIESVKSNEGSAVVKPFAPTTVIILGSQ